MPVTDDAIDKIKAKIIAGILKPGERLPRKQTWPPISASPAARYASRFGRCPWCGSSMCATAMAPMYPVWSRLCCWSS